MPGLKLKGIWLCLVVYTRCFWIDRATRCLSLPFILSFSISPSHSLLSHCSGFLLSSSCSIFLFICLAHSLALSLFVFLHLRLVPSGFICEEWELLFQKGIRMERDLDLIVFARHGVFLKTLFLVVYLAVEPWKFPFLVDINLTHFKINLFPLIEKIKRCIVTDLRRKDKKIINYPLYLCQWKAIKGSF